MTPPLAARNGYYDTTFEERADKLRQYQLTAERQERVVLMYALRHPGEAFTEQSIEHLFPFGTPITSRRRAICRVMQQGNIMKAGKVLGRFGRRVYSYMLVPTETLVGA